MPLSADRQWSETHSGFTPGFSTVSALAANSICNPDSMVREVERKSVCWECII
jgi:hypothetical protein